MTADGPSAPSPEERFESFVDPIDGTRWSVDVGFLSSGWRCLWAEGCPGILDRPAAELGQGCCSVGAELLDADEARAIAALGVALDPARFQQWAEAKAGGVVEEEAGRERPWATRVVDGACVFLNRPGFEGGPGCALHLAAEDEGEDPIDWKPSVCWQLPVKIDDSEADEGDAVRVLRRWGRDDWGPGGHDMAWCCTEDPADPALPSAYGGSPSSVAGPPAAAAETLSAELQALVGPEVAVAIQTRVGELNPG